MKFDIENYSDDYVMHCKTEKEAQDFCHYLRNIGRKWIQGGSYDDKTQWNVFKENTVYYFNKGTYCDISEAKKNNYTILEWEDFMNNIFTKADLKTGDVILRRNGNTEICNCELNMLITQHGWNDLNDISNDLTDCCYGRECDIMAVRRPCNKCDCAFSAFEFKRGELVYERKEVEEMALEEVCKLLGKEIKIIK